MTKLPECWYHSSDETITIPTALIAGDGRLELYMKPYRNVHLRGYTPVGFHCDPAAMFSNRFHAVCWFDERYGLYVWITFIYVTYSGKGF